MRHESDRGCGGMDLGTRRRRVMSLTLRSLYSRGKRPRYPFDRRLGRSQNLRGRCEEETNPCRCRELNRRTPETGIYAVTLSRSFCWLRELNYVSRYSSVDAESGKRTWQRPDVVSYQMGTSASPTHLRGLLLNSLEGRGFETR
jgi:hypothetical protein